MIRIRAFRAIDEPESCKRYLQEHMEVLKIFGITKITTANDSWTRNPSVYVIMAESMEDNSPVGGARIHLYNEEFPLPIEDAIRDFDPSVIPMLKEHNARGGTSEICGLWNSRNVAGLGIGTLFLARAGVALAAQLPMHSMFVLCGEHTIGITLEKGFTIAEELGNSGTFYYPKEGLIATAAVMNDIHDLSNAKDEDRSLIAALREHPDLTRIENAPKGELAIEYRLKL